MFFRPVSFLFFFFCLNLHAQYDQYGVIYPDTANTEQFCCTFFPLKSTLKLYDAPNGKAAGKIVRQSTSANGHEDFYTLLLINRKNDTTKIDLWGDMKEIGYESAALTFSARKNGFVRVLNSLGGFWVNTEELKALQFEALSYQEFMTRKSGKVLGFYPEEKLNLRESPSATAKKIETLSFMHEISLTGEHKGAWSKIKVIKLKEERCENGNELIEYELEGWIKVLDNEGLLNIWYYTRGC